MKRLTYATCMAVMLGMVGLGAQQSTTDMAQKDKTAKAGTVTVTGCVADKDANGKYMLNNARIGDTSNSASSATGTTGSTAAETSSYELSGGNLKAHVGHKVEVTGTLQAAKNNARNNPSSSTTATGTAGSASNAYGSSNNSVLRVKSVKMVSESCNQ
jgi:hypothetical protein